MPRGNVSTCVCHSHLRNGLENKNTGLVPCFVYKMPRPPRHCLGPRLFLWRAGVMQMLRAAVMIMNVFVAGVELS